VGARNLFVGILGIGQNVRERAIGWKISQQAFIESIFLIEFCFLE
jgi:hypothetical protein